MVSTIITAAIQGILSTILFDNSSSSLIAFLLSDKKLLENWKLTCERTKEMLNSKKNFTLPILSLGMATINRYTAVRAQLRMNYIILELKKQIIMEINK